MREGSPRRLALLAALTLIAALASAGQVIASGITNSGDGNNDRHAISHLTVS